jgi:hypothetical protein
VATGVVAALIAAGCANSNPALVPPPPVGAVSLQNNVQPIFSTTCAASSSCHAGSTPQAGMNLEPGQSYANLVGPSGTGVQSLEVPSLMRVKPGDSSQSYIIDKLEGTNIPTGLAQMPFGGPYLSPSTIQIIKDWINQGAKDN